MSISQRKHVRLTLDIPAVRHTAHAEKITTLLYQISIGGCLIEWDDSIEENEDFRMEMQLPDGNWLPLSCRALYRFPDDGIGIQFQDITEFEQELIAKIIANNLEMEGLPMGVDPFAPPKDFAEAEKRKTTPELNGDG